MKTYSFSAMNTIIQLGIERSSHAKEELVKQAQGIFQMIEQTCSRFLPNSELSLLNSQLGKELALSPLLFSILQQAERFHEETKGLFQPGVLSSLERVGYQQSIEHIRGQEVSSTSVGTATLLAKLPYTLNHQNISVILKDKIDLGGIAKGWAVDYAAAMLQAHADGFINAGGDMRIFGKLSRDLHVGIEHPYIPEESMAALSLAEGAVATSSTTKRRWKQNGEWKHHLIDPRTGTSAQSRIVSVTVTAPTAVQADVWAKTILMLGEEDGRAWVKQKGQRAVWMNEFGEIVEVS